MAELDPPTPARSCRSRSSRSPTKRKYPIEDKAHASNAKSRASQAVKAGRMSKAEEAKIDKKADAVPEEAERREGGDAPPQAGWSATMHPRRPIAGIPFAWSACGGVRGRDVSPRGCLAAHAAGLPARGAWDSGRASPCAPRPRSRARSPAGPWSAGSAGAPARAAPGSAGRGRRRRSGWRGQAEELLHPHLDARPALGGVVDGEARAGRRVQARRRLGDPAGAGRPRGSARAARRRRSPSLSAASADVPASSGASQSSRPRQQRRVGQVGRSPASRPRRKAARARRRLAAVAPGQRAQALARAPRPAAPRRSAPGRGWSIRRSSSTRRPSATTSLGPQPAAGVGSSRPRRGSSRSAKAVLQLGLVERRGQQDAVARLAAAQFAPPPARAPAPGLGRLQVGAAAGGQLEFAGRAARLGDPLRIGLGQQQARRSSGAAPAGAAGLARPSARPELRGVAGPRAAVAAEAVQPVAQVDVAAAEAALDEQRGDPRGALGLRRRRAPCSTMCASRGGSGDAGHRAGRAAVSAPAASSAPSRCSSARASAMAAAGGGSRKARPAASPAPQRARSSARPRQVGLQDLRAGRTGPGRGSPASSHRR